MIPEDIHTDLFNRLKLLWQKIYGNEHDPIFNTFIEELETTTKTNTFEGLEPEWYRDVVVYSLYVDRFNKDFNGLEQKLDYLSGLGVSCLWLLPILDSPMRDAGFDIRDFKKIRPELIPEGNQDEAFRGFISKAHETGIKVIFDIALNHTSDEHPWFVQARQSRENPYRDYYIWSSDDQKYGEARIIFQGIESGNWKRDGDEFYFHRFFDFQPDLNYRNPLVLVEMCRIMLYWLQRGVDGFRADAIPYLWKEEMTDCENLDTAHDIMKFIRAALEIVRPNTLLLAEACQKPIEVVKYFGDGDECQAAYHFPLMPQIFKSISAESSLPVINILDSAVTPELPDKAQWFTFLRCHDELSLELVYVSEEDRAYIHNSYCHQKEWDFREGQGISARLSELMERDPRKICLAFSIMLSLPGTPVIYYGDEFGKLNDSEFYEEQISKTGKDDTRFLVRGKIEWDELKRELNDEDSLPSRVLGRVAVMLSTRNKFHCFGRGSLTWLNPAVSPAEFSDSILAFERRWNDEAVIAIHNLSKRVLQVSIEDLPEITLTPYGYKWIELQSDNKKE